MTAPAVVDAAAVLRAGGGGRTEVDMRTTIALFVAATLQAGQGCDRPVLIRIETQGSHGYRPTDKRIAELADEWAFALANMKSPAPSTAAR